jgi:phospholipid-binding lipoprotein MlaA
MRTLLLTFVAAACLAAPAYAQDGLNDPAEGWNRSMYAINDAVDRAVLEPVARGYRYITPSPVRAGVRNFLRNLRGPVVFANDVLQGEFSRAGTTASRFAINSTFGVAGLVDVAEEVGIERHDEDFGQTLAVWGVPAGAYLYLPLLGPSNVRDGAGRVVDVALNPLTWAEFEGDDAFLATRTVVGAVSTREELIEPVEDLRNTSIDPYVTIRSTYALTRESAIRNGLQDVQDLPEFEQIYETPAADDMDGVATSEGEQGIPQ